MSKEGTAVEGGTLPPFPASALVLALPVFLVALLVVGLFGWIFLRSLDLATQLGHTRAACVTYANADAQARFDLDYAQIHGATDSSQGDTGAALNALKDSTVLSC